MSAFLRAIFIFGVKFWRYVMWWEGGAKCYINRIVIILSSSYSSHYIATKSDPKKWKWRSEMCSFLFFPLNFLKIKLYRAPLNLFCCIIGLSFLDTLSSLIFPTGNACRQITAMSERGNAAEPCLIIWSISTNILLILILFNPSQIQ